MASNTRGYATAIAVAVALVLTSTLTVWGGASTIDVGEYVQDGETRDLTESHVTDTADGFRIDAPDAADEIRVNPDYIDQRLDDFDVDHAYQTTSDRVIVADDTATFTDFAASSETVFTRGSADSIRFAKRPMWLRVDTSGAESVSFEAHDATNDGQAVRVDASWLESRGVQGEPLAYYHDGTPIPVEPSNDGTAYRIEAPHFSHIKLECAGGCLDTGWKTEGHTRNYYANSPNESGLFNVTVADVKPDEITFEFWTSSNGSRNSFDGGLYEKVGRESLNRSGYYAFNYINETNLANGYTTLGRERYELVEVNLRRGTYDFRRGNLTYQFDDTTGFLDRVVDDGNDSSIINKGVRTGHVGNPVLGPFVAQITDPTTNGFWVDAWYNDWVSNPAETRITTDWSGGRRNEVVQGNILSRHTEVDVVAGYHVHAAIDTYDPDNNDKQDCLERGECHTNALMQGDTGSVNFHVHFSDTVGTNSEVLSYCDSQDCEWKDSGGIDGSPGWYSSKKEGLFIVTGEYDHGLLGKTSEPFWLCGRARVWNDTDASNTAARLANDVNCQNDLSTDPSTASGWVTVDALPPS